MINQSSHNDIILLDGGTGEELFKRGVPNDRRIWSARALVDAHHHATVKAVHLAFIQAGSRIITTANYAVTPGTGLGDRIEELCGVAGRLADEAREYATRLGYKDIMIAGCLPPLVESYRPDLVLEHRKAKEWYERIISSLKHRVDLWLGETLSSIREGQAIIAALAAQGIEQPFWLSFTLDRRGTIRDGEDVRDALRTLAGEGVSAFLFNCSEPESITKAFNKLAQDTGIQKLIEKSIGLGAYANRLTPVPDNYVLSEESAPQAMREDLDTNRYLDFVHQWVKLGARIIGGCCGIGPHYIETLHESFHEQTGDHVSHHLDVDAGIEMDALLFEREVGLRRVNRVVPMPGARELLVEISAAGICGSDLHVLEGISNYASPIIPGHEGVGIVRARGVETPSRIIDARVVIHPQFECGECSWCRRGQPNFCEHGGYDSTIGYWKDGCWADFVIVHESQVQRIPPDLPDEIAVLTEPFGCILNGWKKVRPLPPEPKILVMGAGIFGLLWALFLEYKRMPPRVLTEVLEGRRAIASTLARKRWSGSLVTSPNDLAKHERFDLIIDACGQNDALQWALDHLDAGGQLLVFGGPPRGQTIEIESAEILFQELTLTGSVIAQNTFGPSLELLWILHRRGFIDLNALGIQSYALAHYETALSDLRRGIITKAVFTK